VWRTTAGTPGAPTTEEVTTGSVGVSTAASRNASSHFSSGNSTGSAGEQNERNWHRDRDRPNRRAPVQPEEFTVDEQAVGEQRQHQRQLDQVHDGHVRRIDRDDAGLREDDAHGDRKHGDREHRPVHQPREASRNQQQQPDGEKCLRKADLHGWAYTRSSQVNAGRSQGACGPVSPFKLLPCPSTRIAQRSVLCRATSHPSPGLGRRTGAGEIRTNEGPDRP